MNTTGTSNVFIGSESGYTTSTGTSNVFMGTESGFRNTTGNQNTCIGEYSGSNVIDGEHNTFLGCSAGQNFNNISCTYIGAQTASRGDDNVLLGYNATGATGGMSPITNAVAIGALSSVTSANTMALGGTGTLGSSSALTVVINQTASTSSFGTQIGGGATLSGPYRLEVNGDAYISGLWYASDSRYKKDINDLTNGMNIIRKLHPVSYNYRDDVFFKKHDGDTSKPLKMEFSKGIQIGFLAQELESVIPSAVMTRGDGYKAVNYNQILGVIVQSLQEQDSVIMTEKNINEELSNKILSLQDQNEKLVNAITSINDKLFDCLCHCFLLSLKQSFHFDFTYQINWTI